MSVLHVLVKAIGKIPQQEHVLFFVRRTVWSAIHPQHAERAKQVISLIRGYVQLVFLIALIAAWPALATAVTQDITGFNLSVQLVSVAHQQANSLNPISALTANHIAMFAPQRQHAQNV